MMLFPCLWKSASAEQSLFTVASSPSDVTQLDARPIVRNPFMLDNDATCASDSHGCSQNDQRAMTHHDLHGLCAICGHVGIFLLGEARSVREAYACPSCHFPLRWRDQAGVIVDEFERGQALSLAQLVANGFLNEVAIYEPALRGPVCRSPR
jgi:hypothetical protein